MLQKAERPWTLATCAHFWKWRTLAVFSLLHAGWVYRSQSQADGSRASNERLVSNFYRARRMGLCLQKSVRPFANMPLE